MTQEQLTAVLNGLRNSTEESKSYSSRFLVKDGEKEILLSVEKIDWIEAADYYCCLHVRGRRYMLRESIADLNNKLDPKQFVRIHRSSIVNLDQIREIYRDGQTEGTVVFTDGQKLRMSRAGRQKLMELGKGYRENISRWRRETSERQSLRGAMSPHPQFTAGRGRIGQRGTTSVL